MCDVKVFRSDSHLPKKKGFICFNANPLKMMKNVFYFIIKALFVLKIFKFLSYSFVMFKKPRDQKDKVNFKIYDDTACSINYYKTHCPVSQEIKGNQVMKITREIFFFAYHAQNEPRKLVPDLFLFFLKNLFEVKASGLFQYISIALNLAYNKIKLHTTLNY